MARLPDLPVACWPKLAFSAKEAFYKCVDPLLGEFLEFHEVAVRFGLDPTGDRGEFEVALLKPGLAARVPPSLLAGRWAVDRVRVYTGVTWLRASAPGAGHAISLTIAGTGARSSTSRPPSSRTIRSAVWK